MPPQTIGGSNAQNVNPKIRPVSAKARELLNDQHNGFPVWIRPPRGGGLEFYSGLSRAKLYELGGKGHIQTRSIREPGAIKGTRLFLLRSILDFIDNLPESQPAEISKRREETV